MTGWDNSSNNSILNTQWEIPFEGFDPQTIGAGCVWLLQSSSGKYTVFKPGISLTPLIKVVYTFDNTKKQFSPFLLIGVTGSGPTSYNSYYRYEPLDVGTGSTPATLDCTQPVTFGNPVFQPQGIGDTQVTHPDTITLTPIGFGDILGTGSVPPGPRYYCCSNHVDLFAGTSGSVVFATLDNGQVLEYVFQHDIGVIGNTAGYWPGAGWIWRNDGSVPWVPAVTNSILSCIGRFFSLNNIPKGTTGIFNAGFAQAPSHVSCNPFLLRFPKGGSDSLSNKSTVEFTT
jgi:hypothetical protein